MLRCFRFHISVLGPVAVAATVVSVAASAGDAGCDDLIGRAARLGEAPIVGVDTATETVILTTSFGNCRETVDEWSGRRLPDFSGRPRGEGAQDYRKGGRGAFVSSPAACDLKIEDVWTSVWLNFRGGAYWLDRIYTVDFDHDGRTDNLKFRFLPESESAEPLTLPYLSRTGEFTAADLGDLGRVLQGGVGRVCFGDARFEKPRQGKPLAIAGGRIRPGLAGRAGKRESDVRRSGRAAEKPEAGNKTIWIWIGLGGAGAVLLGLAGLYVFLTGRKSRISKRDRPPIPSEYLDEWEENED